MLLAVHFQSALLVPLKPWSFILAFPVQIKPWHRQQRAATECSLFAGVLFLLPLWRNSERGVLMVKIYCVTRETVGDPVVRVWVAYFFLFCLRRKLFSWVSLSWSPSSASVKEDG